MKFKLPESTYDPEPPPVLGSWGNIYVATLAWLAILILVFYCFTRYFSQ